MPFPRVPQSKEQALALRDAIDAAALSPGRAGIPERQALRKIAQASDGAGRALLEVETIAGKASRVRTIQRALSRLEVQGNVERVRLRRQPRNYSDELHRLARQGEGPSVYRIGRALRADAGLVELDWTPEPDLVFSDPPVSPPDEAHLSPPTKEVEVSPPDEAELSPPAVTPCEPHEVPANAGGVTEGHLSPHERRTTNQDQAGNDQGVEGTHAQAGAREGAPMRAPESAHAPVAARGQPVYCSNHEKETEVATVTAGLVYFACGCFAHENEWEATSAA